MAPRLPPHSWVGGLGSPHVPALREIFIVRLGDELPDDLGFRGAKLLHELLELGLRRVIQPQHQARAIGAGIMRTLL
jgi:hypothetical protein